MSTEYQIIPAGAVSFPTREPLLELAKRGSTFDLSASDEFHAVSIACKLTVDELIDVALRLMQPALYNVEDEAALKARIKAAVDRM